ncbi:hypothetical protein PC118_g25339 [Phytophthora cactorum]|uniref:Uncharacterized protein n=1 Tax=Phytophthora cactorum TaxID=29920 RepID=A0A8T1EE25_9STRA|nr:hypothetical protein PC111_g24919 [Phytophthora cactorum]KAG2949566.1 hypothetical protein PC118_g25339 [Phytophthora cactorum]
MATSNVASSTVSGSAAMTASGGLSASSGVNTAMMGAIASGEGVSGMNVSSVAPVVTSAGLDGYTGGGFTFIGSTGSGAVMNSVVSVALDAVRWIRLRQHGFHRCMRPRCGQRSRLWDLQYLHRQCQVVEDLQQRR